MFGTNINTADAVSRWTGLGDVVSLPDDLQRAVEVFEALRYVEVEYPVEVDLTGITAENAEAMVFEFADRLVPSLKTGGDNRRTPLEEAKSQMLTQAAREVVVKASAAVPAIIDQLRTEFDAHADAYVAAVGRLPDTITPEIMFRAGAGAVSAYGTAEVEAAWLNRVSSWVAGTRDLPGHGGDIDVALRILRPASAAQLAKLDAAERRTNVDPTLSALDRVLFCAAKEGVEFGINTLSECAEIRHSLEFVSPQQISFR